MDEKENQLVHHLFLQAARLQRLNRDDDDQAQDDNSVATAKITAMCVLFVSSVVCGCIPFLLNRWFKWTDNNASLRSATVVKALLYFGGGVLLSTTFLHLVPEVTLSIESLQECDLLPNPPIHLSHLLMCVGFFAMYLVEESVHAYIHNYLKNEGPTQKEIQERKQVRSGSLVIGLPADIHIGHNHGTSKEELVRDDLEHQNHDEKYESVEKTKDQHIGGNHNHVNSAVVSDDGVVSALRGLLIVLALSIHELFEGLAVGLESDAQRVWYMFGAIAAHKLVLAFCVGVELIVNRTKMWLAIVYVVSFAIASALGIGIGILISSDDDGSSAVPSAILQGLASGTLLYVVFLEILSKERSGLINYAAFVVGFLVMSGIQLAATIPEDSNVYCDLGKGDELINGNGEKHLSIGTSSNQHLKLIKTTVDELAQVMASKIK